MKKGVERAMTRSLFYAMGYTREEIERPIVGVVNTFNQIIPGHIHLNNLTEAVVRGVSSGGGTPVVFPAIGVCDGIAMGHEGMKYSLASRELIADSVEVMAMAHPFDAPCDGDQLRQDKPRHGHGGPSIEYTRRHFERRPHACGKLEGPKQPT